MLKILDKFFNKQDELNVKKKEKRKIKKLI